MSSASNYKVGDKITVTFTGTIYETDSHDMCAKVADDGEFSYNHYVYLESPGVEVTRADPANWPPQVGDIWEAEGQEYYVRVSKRDALRLFIGSFGGELDYLEYEVHKFKELNPKLIRRR